MAPQILRLGPPSSDPKIQPAGASGKVRCPQIGCVRPLLRWIITTRAWFVSVAMEATQLAAGGASADDEVNATQPPVDADTLESTQPADNGGKACARFVRVAGPGRVAMETESQFEVSWQHGERVELGRAGSTGSGGSARVVLCASCMRDLRESNNLHKRIKSGI